MEKATEPYGYVKMLTGVSVGEARARVTEALAGEGFGVLTEINIAATLKKKLGAEFRPYVILGACNPSLAHRALVAEEAIGLLLPCNVVVQEVEGGAQVAIADPRAMFSLVDNPDLDPVVSEADARLRRALEAV